MKKGTIIKRILLVLIAVSGLGFVAYMVFRKSSTSSNTAPSTADMKDDFEKIQKKVSGGESLSQSEKDFVTKYTVTSVDEAFNKSMESKGYHCAQWNGSHCERWEK